MTLDLSNHPPFDTLTAIRPTGEKLYGNMLWLCRCSCGTEVVKKATDLVSGRARCMNPECKRARKKPRESPRMLEILFMVRSGSSVTKVARQFSLSDARVYQILARFESKESMLAEGASTG